MWINGSYKLCKWTIFCLEILLRQFLFWARFIKLKALLEGWNIKLSLRKLYKGYEIKNFLLYSLHHEQESRSDKRRGQIVAFRKANFSIRKIAKEFNRSGCVIKCFLDDPDSYGDKYVGERPKTLSKQSQRSLIREASRGEYSCKQLKDKLDLDVHVRTISNYLNSSGQLKYEMSKRLRKRFERSDFYYLTCNKINIEHSYHIHIAW